MKTSYNYLLKIIFYASAFLGWLYCPVTLAQPCSYNQNGVNIYVTSKFDYNPGCLRDAINYANSQNIGGRIYLKDTMYLNAPLPPITTDSLLLITPIGCIINAQNMVPDPIFQFTQPNICFEFSAPTYINVAPALLYVTNTNDTGPGSLREAITIANYSPSFDNIYFNIPGPAPHVIQPLTSLPFIQSSVEIDGSIQPNNGYLGDAPKIELDGANCSGIGLHVNANKAEIYGLFIRNFNYGIDVDAKICIIGSQYKRNVISGNNNGLILNVDSALSFQYNYIGTNGTGDSALLNNSGAAIWCTSPTGSALISDNIVSGNNRGIEVGGSALISIKRNKFGTDKTGMFAVPNNTYALLSSGSNTSIGSSNSNDGNLFSGNICSSINGFSSVLIVANYPHLIKGNKFGTTIYGNDTLPNHNGSAILVYLAKGTIIGGSLPGERNIIHAPNANVGVAINPADNVKIINNYFGTDVNGATIFQSTGAGIGTNTFDSLEVINNLIAGDSIGISVSHNFSCCNGNKIQGNTIKNNAIGIWNANQGCLITNNSIYDNSIGIKNYPYANDSILPPDIAAIYADSIIGYSRPYADIEIFYSQSQNNTPQGKDFIGTVTADSLGRWKRTGTLNLTKSITATQTTNNLYSSAFAEFLTRVWPGDINYDLVVDNLDFLFLNIAINDSGEARSNASLNWIAQPCNDWYNSFASGVNYKHADTDGNGVVNQNDTNAIILNYNLTHAARPINNSFNSSFPDFSFLINEDSVSVDSTITIEIYAGSALLPIDSLYGLAFSFSYDASLIDTTSISYDFSQSALGAINSDLQSFQKPFYSNSKIDFALCRTNHSDTVNFSGLIGKINLKALNSVPNLTSLYFFPSNVKGITHSETFIDFNAIGDSVKVFKCTTTGNVVLNNQYICKGDTVFATASISDSSQVSWHIDSALVAYGYSISTDSLSAGSHLISAQVINPYCNYFISQTVVVIQPDTPAFTVNADTLSTTATNNIQWLLNGNMIPGANQNNYTIQQSGWYSLMVTDTTGCIAVSDSVYVSMTGIENKIADEILIWPNPVQHDLLILIPNNGEALLSVNDLNGRNYIQSKLHQDKNHVSLINLANGIYVLRIKYKDGFYFKRIIKL